MNIVELLERSKNQDRINFDKIGCTNEQTPLVAAGSSRHLLVEPIWQVPIDELEGPLYQEYMKDHPKYQAVYVREEAASRLLHAAKSLPRHLRLILRAGHRPIEVQLRLLYSLVDEYSSANPEATRDQALAFARTYVGDPAIKLPPHCCGAAVDVDVMDTNTGDLIDFGCPVNTDSEISFLHSDKINAKQYANRITLLKAMLSAGFASCYSEWWHFSYGDQIWAYFYNKPKALYGITEPKL